METHKGLKDHDHIILQSNIRTWTRNDKEKAEAFSKYLESVFKPYSLALSTEEEIEITDFLNLQFQMDLPNRKFNIKKAFITFILLQANLQDYSSNNIL